MERKQSRSYELASELLDDLRKICPGDSIKLCGLAPLRIMETRAQEVLDLASSKIHSYPYHAVPTCWRRLYEEATLHLVVGKLQSETQSSELIADIVRVLDLALIISGAPKWQALIHDTLSKLLPFIPDEPEIPTPQLFHISRPKLLKTNYSVTQADHCMDICAFQTHLDTVATPLVIPDALNHWPAQQRWQDVSYLLRSTLGGRRLVPIEIGRSYMDEAWTQQIVTFDEFVHRYLLPQQANEVGYLAQHDLFTQVPSLRNDIRVPDYCYSLPQQPAGHAANTPGLAPGHTDEPLMNAWLGPKGTKTPLHTDPFHNMLCQVVGYKYIRLYPPEESLKLYPQTSDETGIKMDNTSQVDVSYFRPELDGSSKESCTIMKERLKYPLLASAKYLEAVLGPGQSLYIPLGWWHYLESLSTSFSVSFWWR